MQQRSVFINADVLGKDIAQRRVSLGYTQDFVAEYLGIGVEAVSRLERGVVLPSLVRLAGLAELFQCRMVDLLGQSSTRPSDQVSHFNRMLESLCADDRMLIMKLMEQLVVHMRERSPGATAGSAAAKQWSNGQAGPDSQADSARF